MQNHIEYIDLTIVATKEADEPDLKFKTTKGGLMVTFKAKEKVYGKGCIIWSFKGFDKVAERIRNMKLKAGDHINVRGSLDAYPGTIGGQSTMFYCCNISDIGYAQYKKETSSENEEQKKNVVTQEQMREKIEKYVQQETFSLADCDIFSQQLEAEQLPFE